MTSTPTNIAAPRFENAPLLLIAGIGQRHAMSGAPAIPLQWQKLVPWLDSGIPGQKGDITYGVCANADDDGAFDYVAGVEVERFADLPAEFATIRIPARRYAVFTHKGHVSSIQTTFKHAWGVWLPSSGEKASDAPMFERYDHRFDPMTGTGDVEVWLPLEG